jgi:phosphoglycerate dehydrogenase-like enzyme
MATLLFGGNPDRIGAKRLAAVRKTVGDLDLLVTDDPEAMREQAEAVVVAAGDVPVDVLAACPNLRWFQRWYAGVEDLVAEPRLAERNVVVTNARGVHAEPMAEQVFGMLIALYRKMDVSFRNQTTATWKKPRMSEVDELFGKSMLVVGLGAIGRRIAEIAQAFAMRVSGVTRETEPDDIPCVRLDQLASALSGVDVVVNVLPLTPDTERVFDSRAFSAMKPGATFVNIGRGRHVDQDAMIDALERAHLGGACLDVTDPEPLPAESPLWSMDNVLITPHMGGFTRHYGERAWEIFLDNLARFTDGRELRNVVDLRAGY